MVGALGVLTSANPDLGTSAMELARALPTWLRLVRTCMGRRRPRAAGIVRERVRGGDGVGGPAGFGW
jgi:hypothetical protein